MEKSEGTLKSEKTTLKTCLQAIVGGVVAAGLVAAWLIVYLQPILSAKFEEQAIRNNIAVLKISQKQQELDAENKKLTSKRDALLSAVKKLELENNNLQVQYAVLEEKQTAFIKQYRELIEKEKKAKSDSQQCLSEKESLASRISTMEENVKVYEKQASDTQEARKETERSSKFIQNELEKASVQCELTLPVSWVKPRDWLGRHYKLTIDKGIYIWPTELDEESSTAKYIINTSSLSRDSGIKLIEDGTISVGSEVTFKYEDASYKLKLLSIRQAGKLPSDAAYFTADKCTGGIEH
ncbi:hypothetical protein HG263_20215 [Pseudoalteromonas sp. JBTF-M23]|uniref:Uncharacterized protein n=1 Tax=Pseudoalteromonas caenipelagi TaxID=2726988 RepID=A0A849VMP4_9GAMM|nr:hypothetical protein [Pseudoalteromonas caenipelagi]NOU52837.1 hypothetical protein [Pseudoalteromonas caenipelagi]